MAESNTEIAKLSFEDAMKALEEVVGQLEKGEVPLEQSIELYQRGAALRAHCETKLREAEEKIAKISLDSNGQPKGTEPLDVS
ncbi:exodeoxyribonuclease VII small subunit [Paracoccaceae bacterium GXU_MW_L88]